MLSVHGLIHLMGVALLWRLSEPGQFRYADVRPAAGSSAAIIVGAVWLIAGAAFIAAGLQAYYGRPTWRALAVAAIIMSLPLLLSNLSVASAGVAVDAAVIGALVVSWVLWNRNHDQVRRAAQSQ